MNKNVNMNNSRNIYFRLRQITIKIKIEPGFKD